MSARLSCREGLAKRVDGPSAAVFGVRSRHELDRVFRLSTRGSDSRSPVEYARDCMTEPATTACDSAAEFLSELLQVGFDQRPSRTVVPIFRGVGDVDRFPLVPSALREQNADLVSALCTTADVPHGGEFGQRHSELSILLRFYERANRSGLASPGPQQSLTVGFDGDLFVDPDRSQQLVLGVLPGVDINLEGRWLPPGLLELAALAQHYGLPTRLLDWSTDAATAAFFAAHSAANRLHAAAVAGREGQPQFEQALTTSMGVWMLNVKTVMGKDCPIEIAYPPYAGNPNLCAQQGVLTHWRSTSKIDVETAVDREPLDDKIRKWNDSASPEQPMVQIQRFTLPASQSFQLCKLLDHHGYHHGRLVPGYAGAAQAVEAYGRRRWTADLAKEWVAPE